jgi:hypothetical protein
MKLADALAARGLHAGALLLDNQPQGGAKVLVALPLATARYGASAQPGTSSR